MVRGAASPRWLTRRSLVTLTLLIICLTIIRLTQISYHEDPRLFGHSVSAIKKETGNLHSWYFQIQLKQQQEEDEKRKQEEDQQTSLGEEGKAGQEITQQIDPSDDDESSVLWEALGYRLLESLTSSDKKYWKVDLLGMKGYNMNMIPHPTNKERWIVVLQHEQYGEGLHAMEEMACEAIFTNGALTCLELPKVLPITTGADGVCEGKIESYKLLRGPRDARMFYGPDEPYIMFGTQSAYICLGLWVQDIRPMLDAFPKDANATGKHFQRVTELQRPDHSNVVEKNYFLFWDSNGVAHTHYSIYPKRAFAEIHDDGTGIKDLAPVNNKEITCLNRLMPEPKVGSENLHQATNSLRITLCNRYDQNCVPDDSNTYIMHIFQHKLYYEFHANYRPYVFLFQQSAPFAAHAVGQKPLWINGRGRLTDESQVPIYKEHPEWLPKGHTEFFYITSMSWKGHDQKYHGYIDDVILLTFGIEDSRGGVIDVLAKDLLQDLEYC